jgi:hypothetical protein
MNNHIAHRHFIGNIGKRKIIGKKSQLASPTGDSG